MRILILLFAAALVTTSCKTNQNNTTQTANSTTKTKTKAGDRPTRGGGDKKGPPSIDEVFKMDANNDGMLSKTEVTGRLAEQFDVIDVDNDGLITRTEFENAPKPQRGQRPKRND